MLYCSKTLILSICSLGAKMSTEETIYNRSKEFYQELKYLLLNFFISLQLHHYKVLCYWHFMIFVMDKIQVDGCYLMP